MNLNGKEFIIIGPRFEIIRSDEIVINLNWATAWDRKFIDMRDCSVFTFSTIRNCLTGKYGYSTLAVGCVNLDVLDQLASKANELGLIHFRNALYLERMRRCDLWSEPMVVPVIWKPDVGSQIIVPRNSAFSFGGSETFSVLMCVRSSSESVIKLSDYLDWPLDSMLFDAPVGCGMVVFQMGAGVSDFEPGKCIVCEFLRLETMFEGSGMYFRVRSFR